MNKVWPLIALCLFLILAWRFVVPALALVGIFGGVFYFVERVLGINIFPEKTRGG